MKKIAPQEGAIWEEMIMNKKEGLFGDEEQVKSKTETGAIAAKVAAGALVKIEKARDIDSKFAVSRDGRIYKKSNMEVLEENEPLFLLRARDMLSLKTLASYINFSREAGCNDYHFTSLEETVAGFVKFKNEHSDLMKVPSITEGR